MVRLGESYLTPIFDGSLRLSFEGERVVGVDFSKVRPVSFGSVGSYFESCDFSG